MILFQGFSEKCIKYAEIKESYLELRKMKVLIIDDNSEITDMLAFYLEENGYECKIINDGKEGLQALKSEDFDLACVRVF